MEKLTDEIAKSNDEWVAKARTACESRFVETVANEKVETLASSTTREETDVRDHVVDPADAPDRDEPDAQVEKSKGTKWVLRMSVIVTK